MVPLEHVLLLAPQFCEVVLVSELVAGVVVVEVYVLVFMYHLLMAILEQLLLAVLSFLLLS